MAVPAPTSEPSSDIEDQTFMSAVESVCGVEVANKIREAFGGCSIYIPSDPRPHQPLYELVGMEAAVRIAEIRGNENVNIPLGEFGTVALRRARIKELLLDGVSVRQVARQVGCSDRTVLTYRKRLREEGKLATYRRPLREEARLTTSRKRLREEGKLTTYSKWLRDDGDLT